jgi:hypothetical protein
MLREAADAYAKQLIAQIESMASTDAPSLVTCPTDSNATTLFTGSRAPTLLPDLKLGGPSTQFPTVPVWPTISRWQGQQFETPYVNPPQQPLVNFQASGNSYLGLTNIVISYSAANAATDSSLYGQTRVFPAFRQYTPDPKNPLQYLLTTSGPFLAADATGAGVADSALIPLSSSTIQGVKFYGAIRVVDNADAFNANTSWSREQDLDANTGNCFNFFPSDLDWLGAMNSTTSSTGTPLEMQYINSLRWDNGKVNKTNPNTVNPAATVVKDDNNVTRADFAYLNAADAFWMQLGRRPLNPNNFALFGDATSKYVQPYGNSDSAALAWHGQLIDLDNPLAKLDNQLSQLTTFPANKPDSIYAGAANCVGSAQDRFRYFAANNVGYWYDWNWNFDNVAANAASGLVFPIASSGAAPTSISGLPFRSIRGMTVGNNPTANLCLMVDYATLPDPAKKAAVSPAQIVPVPSLTHPNRTSLNTADFPELWRAFINVMGGSLGPDPATGKTALYVPGDDLKNPMTPNGGICRNVLRDPNAGTSKSTGFTSPIDSASQRFDSKNVLLLRAALAAVNVMTLRESHGYNPTGAYFIPDPVRQAISLQTVNGTPVQVLVYGATANPYIGEVYANTDQSDHSGKANDSGFVAIKLYNPYPFPIQLKDYRLAVVDRRAGTYPNMPVTLLKVLTIPAATATIGANNTVLLTNYNAAGGKPNVKYWPMEPFPAGPPATKIIVVPDLHLVLDDTANGGAAGGELVLLRHLNAGAASSVAFEVPVDSYDFSGLKLNGPKGMANRWHYIRTTGNGTAANRWKCIYPGTYTGKNAASDQPRVEGTDVVAPWDPATKPEPGLNPKVLLTNATNTGTYANFNGIQICNADMGGFNKFTTNATRVFPFGAFARVGDVVQAPYVGSYVVLSSGTAQSVGLTPAAAAVPVPSFSTTVMEINPVTVDTCFADDGDQGDDKFEEVGRFCPVDSLGAGNYNDYNPYGYYTNTDPNPGPTPGSVGKSLWRYRFASSVVDQFTTVSNPELDYFPNINPIAWKARAGQKTPVAVPNLVSTKGNANNLNEFATEGRVNINSASWRMLAAIEMIPASQGGNAPYLFAAVNGMPAATTYNQALAKFIVRYRDVDDGIPKTAGGNSYVQGHGPFKSLMELNKVFDPKDPTRTFQNALKKMTLVGTDPTYYNWGNYAPGPAHHPARGTPADNLPASDWMEKTLMVSRISNMVTLRSDSFTAYVIVQGWRNAGTQFPDLVLQKRMAVLIDRSQVGTTNGTVSSYNIPTD